MRIVAALSVAGLLVSGVQPASAQIHDPYGELFTPAAVAAAPASSLPQDHLLGSLVNLAPAAPIPRMTQVDFRWGNDLKSAPIECTSAETPVRFGAGCGPCACSAAGSAAGARFTSEPSR